MSLVLYSGWPDTGQERFYYIWRAKMLFHDVVKSLIVYELCRVCSTICDTN